MCFMLTLLLILRSIVSADNCDLGQLTEDLVPYQNALEEQDRVAFVLAENHF